MLLFLCSFLLVKVAEQDYEKEKLNERIAKLSGGVAVIQVYLSSFSHHHISGIGLICMLYFHVECGAFVA